MNEKENGDQEEIYSDNIVPTKQKEKHYKKYLISEGGYINNQKEVVPCNQAYAKAARNIQIIRIIGNNYIGNWIKDTLMKKETVRYILFSMV